MKAHKLSAALLACVLVWSLAVPVAAAADVGKSSAVIGFEPGDGAVRPVDPDRPGGVKPPRRPDEVEITPAEPPQGSLPDPAPDPEQSLTAVRPPSLSARIPGETGAGGWLTINYISPLDFSVRLDARTFALRANRPNLQLSDRRGTAGGWKVTAVAGELRGPSGAAVPAVLRLSNGSLNAVGSIVEPPRVEQRVELPADARSERRVLTARPNTGMGTWVLRWYPGAGAHHDLQLELLGEADEPVRLDGWVLWILHDAP